MGKIIHDGASGLDFYLLGYHMAEDLTDYPNIFAAPESN